MELFEEMDPPQGYLLSDPTLVAGKGDFFKFLDPIHNIYPGLNSHAG